MSKTRKARALFRLVALCGRLEQLAIKAKLCVWNRACKAAVENEGTETIFAVRHPAGWRRYYR